MKKISLVPITLAFVVDVNSKKFNTVKSQIAMVAHLMQNGDRGYFYSPNAQNAQSAYDCGRLAATVRMAAYRKTSVSSALVHTIRVMAKESVQVERVIFVVVDDASPIKAGQIRSATAIDLANHFDNKFVICTIGEHSDATFDEMFGSRDNCRYCNATSSGSIVTVLADQIKTFMSGYEYLRPPSKEDVLERPTTEEFILEKEPNG